MSLHLLTVLLVISGHWILSEGFPGIPADRTFESNEIGDNNNGIHDIPFINKLKPKPKERQIGFGIGKAISDDNCGNSDAYSGINDTTSTNGTDAQPKQYPWIASIWMANKFMCTATIISKRWLLCAAHCFRGVEFQQNESDIWLKVGSINLKGGVGHDIEQVITYMSKNTRRQRHNIALIKTWREITFNENASSICLPDNIYQEPSNDLVTVAGWTTNNETEMMPTLQKVDLNLMDTNECDNRNVMRDVGQTRFCLHRPDHGLSFDRFSGPAMQQSIIVNMKVSHYIEWMIDMMTTS